MKIRNKHINESGLSLEDLEQIVNMLYPYDIQNNQHTQSNQSEQNFDFNNSEIPNTNNSNRRRYNHNDYLVNSDRSSGVIGSSTSRVNQDIEG